MRARRKRDLETSAKPATGKVTVTKGISEQLNRMLTAKLGQGELLRHNLEKGLGNEQSLRELLANFLPRRYGVAKGKIANSEGDMSRQLDVIIYDAANCPTLFINEHRNQILPLEGVFGVVEVKTTLSSTSLADAFQNLRSVFSLGPRVNRSTNDLVTACPPYLHVFAFHDSRPLSRIADQFKKLSRANEVNESCYSYSTRSPGFVECIAERYLVCSVDILGKGCVHHMLDGTLSEDDFGEYTLGMFLFTQLAHYAGIQMPLIDAHSYLNWIKVAAWLGPKSSIMFRQVVVQCTYRALFSVHGDVSASGKWRDGAHLGVRLKADIGRSRREYNIVLPRGLSADEMERLAVSQIRAADAAASTPRKVAESTPSL